MSPTIAEIAEAFEFANTGSSMGQFFAFICKRTGKIYYQTDFPDAIEMNDEVPDDVNDDLRRTIEAGLVLGGTFEDHVGWRHEHRRCSPD